MDGGEGKDELVIAGASTAKHSIDGGAGDDTITDLGGNGLLDGGAGKDTITTGAGDDTVFGRAGADTITIDASGGKKLVAAGADDDTIQIDHGVLDFQDTIKGELGSDTIKFDAAVSGDVVDGQFKNVTGVEKISITGLTGGAFTVTAGSNLQTSGVASVDASTATQGATALTIDFSAYTSAQGVSIHGMDTVDDGQEKFVGGKGNDTLDTGKGDKTAAPPHLLVVLATTPLFPQHLPVLAPLL
jgi:hypothetical protein